MKKALCIISGGMDSTVSAYLAKKQGYELIALHFDYGQRTQKKERECFENICRALKVQKSFIFNADFLKIIGANALTDTNIAVPKNELFKTNNSLPKTYVPFRNGIFLSIAGSLAEKEYCESIFLGIIEDDGSGYPDCTESFLKQAELFINNGTSANFRVHLQAPLLHLHKDEIVTLALQEKVPLELTWSCYENENEACGECDSCLLRLKGFQKAKIADTIKYKI
ncbi:7-cyano-7-deazaguanine synthase QueC [Campylobacter sp. MIT 21-1685]|uniref:7-cyano-7-deazaguanine synthase QueC n=1 Tax=unclassified Campylobacter TaxID=2593542 RepID=UPI00224A93B8|nr:MULTISPECIES: 7-cyano-7-deazaguanine synthase QueC [unclassified Campylobacter]MCX2682649.1 7-cyano-7-deazaguanine synthase QueC [Campylobacter sp. MIT 21-1684]MCX2750929.1 7-cyano-7-deazaguanine synthase QueC [Campylobacter sp. MIT 21-1682]MCX2807138.1 7-cyano-7-deazaguanine synthase QueC [Campylobacter sp. MIT 21-1685]